MLIFAMSDNSLAKGLEEKAREQLKHANMWYWLSRVRNGSRVEMKRCMEEYDRAESQLTGLQVSSEESKRLVGELLTQVQDGRDQAWVHQRYARWFLENYSPVLRFLSGQDDVLVRHDLSGLVSVTRALESLLSEHPLLWRGTLYMLVDSEPNIVSDPNIFAGFELDKLHEGRDPNNLPCNPNNLLLEEVVHAYLNTHSNHYAIPRHELRKMKVPYGQVPPDEVLEQICSAYDNDSKAIEGIGIIRITSFDRIHNTNISRAEVHFQHWDRSRKTWGLSYYAMGFCEKRRRLPVLAFFLPVLGLPMACLYRRKARRVKGNPCPVWLPLASAAITVVMLLLGNVGIGKLGPDLNQLCYAPTGLLWIGAISVLYGFLPIAVAYAVSALVPNVGRVLNRPDTTASIVAGSLLGGLALLTNLAWVRSGASAQVFAVAGLGIVMTVAIGYRAGYAWFKWTVTHERASAVAMAILALLGILFTAFLLTWHLLIVFLATLPCLAGIVMLGPLVTMITNASDSRPIREPVRPRDLEDQLLEPDFVVTEAIEGGLDNSLRFLTENIGVDAVGAILIEGLEACGKTRLAREIAEKVESIEKARGTSCTVLYGDNDNPDASSTPTLYAPFVRALGDFLGVHRLADPEQNLHKLRSIVGKAGLKGLGAFGLGILGTTLDVVGLGGERPRQTSEGEIAYVVAQTLWSLSDDELSQKRRILFILDDAHWCDSGSVRLLGRVLELLHKPEAGGRIDFIITARPGSDIKRILKEKRDLGTVRLHIDDKSLRTAEERGEFVEGLLEKLGFDRKARVALSSKCHECGCGRPLHILRMLQAVFANGWIDKINDQYTLSRDVDLDQIRMCDKFREMLDDKFADLDYRLGDILQCCAAIGTEFRVSLIAKIFQIDVFEMLKLLRDAESRNIVEDVREQDDLFRFREKRIAWYFRRLGFVGHKDETPRQTVREYHKRYVKLIEDELSQRGIDPADAPQQDLTILAHHTRFIRDVWPEKTVTYNRLTGERIYNQGTFAEAIPLFEVVDSVLAERSYIGTHGEQFGFYLTFARCLLDAEVGSERAGECIEKLKEMAADETERESLEALWVLEVLHTYRAGQFREAHENALQTLDAEQLLDKNRLRLKFYLAASLPRSDEEALRKSIAAHCEVLNAVDSYLQQKNDDPQVLGEVEALKGEILNNLGFRHLCMPRHESKAEEYFKQALAVKEKPEYNDLKGIAIAHGGLGDYYLELNQPNRAREEYEADYAISRKIGDQRGLCRMSSMLGKIALLEANGASDERSRLTLLESAKRRYEESLYIAQSQRDRLNVLFAMAGLLDVTVESGEEETVERQWDRIYDIVTSQNMKDNSALEHGCRSLLESIERARDRFPNLADRLAGCLAILAA